MITAEYQCSLKTSKCLHRGDRVYEQAHTFSNPLSLRHPWVNLFVLNFGYHNAHHAKPTTPWFRLPALHRECLATMRVG
jgi:fatty acid desaturase